MADIELPAVCNWCSHTFPSGIVIPDPTQSKGRTLDSLRLTLPVRCPKCGGYAWVFLGGSTFFEDVTPILRRSDVTQEDMQELVQLLRELIERQSNANEAQAAIKERAPKFGRLARFVPHGQANVIAFLTLLVALATLVVDVYFKSEEQHSTQSSVPERSPASTTDLLERFMGGWWHPQDEWLKIQHDDRFGFLALGEISLHWMPQPNQIPIYRGAWIAFNSLRGMTLSGEIKQKGPESITTLMFRDGLQVSARLIYGGARLDLTVEGVKDASRVLQRLPHQPGT